MNLTRLNPPDFRAAAAAGAYVYCYLRHKDSATAAAGTPYYIGVSTTARRPLDKGHNAPVPQDASLIRILRADLSWADACEWERFYIKHYGRKDLGTGILLNRTDGGEGVLGLKHSAETLVKMRVINKAAWADPAHRAKMTVASQARWAKPDSRAQTSAATKEGMARPEVRVSLKEAATLRWADADARAKRSASQKAKWEDPQYRTKLVSAHKGKTPSEELKAKLSVALKGKARPAETMAKIAATKMQNLAAKYGVEYDAYASLTKGQRTTLRKRHEKGLRGAALLQGLSQRQPLAS